MIIYDELQVINHRALNSKHRALLCMKAWVTAVVTHPQNWRSWEWDHSQPILKNTMVATEKKKRGFVGKEEMEVRKKSGNQQCLL